jgi:hypothetical protein
MKLLRSVRLAQRSLLLCILAAASSLADKPVKPPAVEEIIGAWFGLDQDRLRFCRLELNAGYTGLCSVTFVDDPPVLYKVSRWSLDGFNLAADLAPLDKEATALYLKGTATRHELILEVGEVSRSWKRELTLFNEKEFLAKNSQARDRVREYREKHEHDP